MKGYFDQELRQAMIDQRIIKSAYVAKGKA